jgi:hypothetical protein
MSVKPMAPSGIEPAVPNCATAFPSSSSSSGISSSSSSSSNSSSNSSISSSSSISSISTSMSSSSSSSSSSSTDSCQSCQSPALESVRLVTSQLYLLKRTKPATCILALASDNHVHMLIGKRASRP